MRRTIDIVVSGVALLALAPMLAAIAASLALSDGRPVLYRQTRIGRNGRPFLILKFRTMRPSASGPNITSAGDRRITAVGQLLRRFKLDELPQFLNVLRGEMSLIGPRPEVPDYVQFDDPIWCEVLSTPPGITDLASLAYRDEEQLLAPAVDAEGYYRRVILPSKLRLNLLYLRSRTFATDLRLLWLTAFYSLCPHRFDRGHVLQSLVRDQEFSHGVGH